MNEAKKIPTPPPAIEREIPKPIGVAPDSSTAKLPEKNKSPSTTPSETKQVTPEIKSMSTTGTVNEVSPKDDLKKP